VDISGIQEQFELFTTMLGTGTKRILSFGGWTFSTDPSTYFIFREAVTAANRDILIASVVDLSKSTILMA